MTTKNILLFLLVMLAGSTYAGETLYNGIELPDDWPPVYDRDPKETQIPVPYLTSPPAVIPIDVGRQLLVDDFLIEKTTLKRTFHTAEYHPSNPVMKPDQPWEYGSGAWFAAPFSGGAWYDPSDKLFKMWYTGGYLHSSCLATSIDGITWNKPTFDIKGDTNIVIPPIKPEAHRSIDTTSVWLEHPATPYESLMIGAFSIWQGPANGSCKRQNLQKRNDILLGFSRDGFHWDRPDRRRFISCTWDAENWRYGNVQSVANVCLVVGDKLYFYFSGRAKPSREMYNTDESKTEFWDADAATGLAVIRRDGFASMDAGQKVETLTTRPLTFKGRHLFVNVDCPDGELNAEVLDQDGTVIEPFTIENCQPVSCDKTLAAVTWKEDLSQLSGQPVRLRFHLENGNLYSFWVSPDKSGASHGYVGGGGPGFTGPIDTVGRGGNEAGSLPDAASRTPVDRGQDVGKTLWQTVHGQW